MGKVILNLNYTAKTPPKHYSDKAKAEYSARRKFYTLTAEYNYFTYVLKDEKVKMNATAEQYFTKNYGLFDGQGVLSAERIAELKEQLKNTDSIIWHGVISFDEETSKHFETQAQAIEWFDKTFGAMIDQTHLDKNNLITFASLHKDTDNRHIHFAFFERAPKHVDKNGNVGYTQKGTLNTKAFENYLISANVRLSKDKDLYYTARNEITNAIKSMRATGVSAISTELKSGLEKLISKLPDTGRLQYQSDNIQPLRAEINALTELLVRSSDETFVKHKQVLEAIAGREKLARKICLENSFAYVHGRRVSIDKLQDVDDTDFTYRDEETGERRRLTVDDQAWEKLDYVEKLKDDYYARLGNQVIGFALDYRKTRKGEKKPTKYNDKAYKRQQRMQRTSERTVINRFVRSFGSDVEHVNREYVMRLREIEWEKQNEKY